MNMYETRLASTKSGFFVDSGLTFVDLRLFNLIDYVGSKHNDAVLEAYPAVKKLDASVKTYGKVSSWLAKRPE
jgi:hypothetical protein